MPKGKKADLKIHAESTGESLNAFVNRAINEAVERDNAKEDEEMEGTKCVNLEYTLIHR